MKSHLHLAPTPQPRIPYALLRKAVALFRNDMVSRSVRRHNARAWLKANEALGDLHLLRGGEARWSGRRT